jgi:hypothetical protein
LTRTDWKGDRFKTIGELWADPSGGLIADPKKAPRDPEGWFGAMSQLLAAGFYNVRQSLPIPLSELITGAQSESSMLAAGLRSVGVDARDVTFKDPNEKLYWDTTQRIKALNTKLKEAQTIGDQKLIYKARRDIKNYPNFNKVKSKLGFTKARLRPINKHIRDLELRQEAEGLSEYELQKLRDYKRKKLDIYQKFAEVVSR